MGAKHKFNIEKGLYSDFGLKTTSNIRKIILDKEKNVWIGLDELGKVHLWNFLGTKILTLECKYKVYDISYNRYGSTVICDTESYLLEWAPFKWEAEGLYHHSLYKVSLSKNGQNLISYSSINKTAKLWQIGKQKNSLMIKEFFDIENAFTDTKENLLYLLEKDKGFIINIENQKVLNQFVFPDNTELVKVDKKNSRILTKEVISKDLKSF